MQRSRFQSYHRSLPGTIRKSRSNTDIAPPCYFVEEQQGEDGRDRKDGRIGGGIPIIAAYDLRIDRDSQCLIGIGIENN